MKFIRLTPISAIPSRNPITEIYFNTSRITSFWPQRLFIHEVDEHFVKLRNPQWVSGGPGEMWKGEYRLVTFIQTDPETEEYFGGSFVTETPERILDIIRRSESIA